MFLSTPGPGSSPHRAAEGIWGQSLLKDRRHGIHEQLSHHTEVLPLQAKSQHVQPGPCGAHLSAQETLTHTCSHLRPSWGDLQRGGSQAAGAMVRRSPRRSADTAAQYLVPLCQEQLPDVNPIWHRVLTVVTPLCPKFRSGIQETLICHR